MASDNSKVVLPVSFKSIKENCRLKDAAKRRRFRRARSAPLVREHTEEVNGDASAISPEPSLKSIHPSLRKVAALLIIYLSAGVVCFYLIRHQIAGEKTNAIIDALYFCVITMTAAGYGDLAPRSDLAKLFAVAYVFLGLALVGLILSEATDYLVEKQEALLVRAFSYEELGPSDIMRKTQTKKTQHKCALVFVFLLVILLSGTLFLRFVEKVRFFEAFYCVCATITTLGYGSPSFSSLGGRIFGVLWILTGTMFVAQFFLCLAELSTEKRQKHLIERVLTRRMTNFDIEAADLDDDGVVDAAEFALYKLKEMGKITEEDLSLVMVEFKELDVDQSGTVSAADITLAQSSPRLTK
ncbi:hypothetical protein BVRB_003720 [Beta vulgaris subsp. vulgaris]|uniref:Potassium channel domain-containing protein n=1 Tax=Beta vulgaris subsp. vulgaris TaxID=3555 RepID=A0A0J8B4M8_BETVV|nr:two-pore potassium channel 1 [Beta vulgaris subsp. vulgaris]XP_048490461.1 two-pore potassium channel 1 [Beta vulgaris subsp. vulgaris]XP_057247062.1 two-pore potassium channel 1 [Beta vulgaris subsp. vulgaris]KMS95936.1 hypothetical protein BVRB_003720 [Beta vulgaris subsp. vulgaris]